MILATILLQPQNNIIGLRDRMILILLYDSAIRLSEALELKLHDVNLMVANPYLRIHGKGNKDRIVSITVKTVDHLKNYLNIYHKVSVDCSSYLFYTKIKGTANRMSPGNVERLIQNMPDMDQGKMSL